MRKILSVGAAALAASLMSSAVSAETVIRIAYPGWDSAEQEEAVTGIFNRYEEQNPDVRIELVSIPFPVMKQQLVVALRSGDAPDMGYIDGRWIPEMQAAGFLADLTERAESLDRDDWHEGPWMASTVDGRIYGIPDRIDPWMIYYNVDLFEAASIDEFPKTMSQLVETGKKLTGDGVYGWGLIGANDATLIGRFLNFLYAFGGGFLNEDGTPSRVDRHAELCGQVDEALQLRLPGQAQHLQEPCVAQPSQVQDDQLASFQVLNGI
jgi:multiple sugar transport system substrate-binding protein